MLVGMMVTMPEMVVVVVGLAVVSLSGLAVVVEEVGSVSVVAGT